jgi:hypothetical protein
VAISWVAAGTAVSVNTTTATSNMPTGWAAGDLLIWFLDSNQDSTQTATTPSGWTLLRSTSDVGASPVGSTMKIFWKIAATGDTAPSSTLSPAAQNMSQIVAYRGVDRGSPFLTENAIAEAGAGTTTVHSAPALTNTDPAAWGIFHATNRGNASPATWTPGTGLTERTDVESSLGTSANVASETSDTNGPAAVGSATYSGTSSSGTAIATMWAAFLRPAKNPRPVAAPTTVAAISSASW